MIDSIRDDKMRFVSRNSFRLYAVFLAAAMQLAFLSSCDGFAGAGRNEFARQRSRSIRMDSVTALYMGLYDKPLPPRPPPREDPKQNDSDEGDEDLPESVTERLFEFDSNGKEKRNLLPPLKRKLTTGVECYFEPTDRLVQNLVDKTTVSVEDACWALEACQGDITEAWTRISVARRMSLDKSRITQIVEEEEDEFDPDDYEIELEDEFAARKAAIERSELKRRRDILNKPSKPDDNWLPTKNPKPIDDEPWFTG